ncbi:VanZ family protein [Actinoplanes sp. CA-054009]
MAHLVDSLLAVVLFALLLPLLALPWIHWQYKRYGRLRGWSAVVAAFEVLYLCGLVAFTLFPVPDETAAFCAARTTADFLNLNPLNDLVATRAGVAQLLLNVVLFVPFGFLARYRFRRSLPVAGAAGLATSLLIETTQGTAAFGLFACPYRVADTGDLITNTAGAVLGWLVAAAIGRFLPAPHPAPSTDVEQPGLLRRGLAVGADLLIGFLATATVLAVLNRTGPVWVTTVSLIAYVVTTLVVPLLRRDHATLGQATLFLAPDSGRAVWPRFLVWWLPVALLQAGGNFPVVLWAMLVVGVLARLRRDRRSVLELVSRSTTSTRKLGRTLA